MTAVAACRTCGTEPRENARFCHGCGSPVNYGDTRAEYKQVTVLFADVVHSMDIAAAVGAERLREIMTELVTNAAGVVQRYGGTVDKFTGEGVMAVFGAPVALEDHALRACLAALGIQEEITRLAAEVERRNGIDLHLRMGLNSGQAWSWPAAPTPCATPRLSAGSISVEYPPACWSPRIPPCARSRMQPELPNDPVMTSRWLSPGG